ncbi:uncharacterized protein LOC123554941 [Mercenaria mercenaria]|uniref:uncharacterized protein LOC123554941 n=1 Tax=Mercenaria mercenaria TaxID=6596 RepID=UPI001E1D857B|nr:uncharacterized protein LOC123554941 [Mercenaria mercenaria]
MILKALTVIAVVALSNGYLQWGKKLPPFASSMYPGAVRERIRIPPRPMPGFNVLPWLGPWYFYKFNRRPCSWSNSEEYTDFTKVLQLQRNRIITQQTMRTFGTCKSVTAIWYVNGPGVFKGIDPVGSRYSFTGTIILVDTDYKGFAVIWGCQKWSVFGNICEDPGLYITTRHLTPHPEVLRRVESVLLNTWDISLNQLTSVPHVKPCITGRNPIG